MFNRGLREEFCTRVTHMYTISVCAVGKRKRLTQRQAGTLNFDCHRNASLRTSRGAFIDEEIFFFAKCNAKDSDTHNVSLHTVGGM